MIPRKITQIFDCSLGLYSFNPLTAGAVIIRFLHFVLAYYISAIKPVKDKTGLKSVGFEIC